MTFYSLLILVIIAWIIWKAFNSTKKIIGHNIYKTAVRKDNENEINEFINNKQCEYSNCKTLNPVSCFEDVKQRPLPIQLDSKPSLTLERRILDEVNIEELGSSPIEQAIKDYNHSIVACHIGTLDSGNKYALIIGTSDEWVNVITYNRATQPVYQEYGFSIKDNRYSYGGKVLGATQIRDVINSNLSEIKAIMATQETVRYEKAKEYEKEEQRIQEEERKNIEEQARRKQYIYKYFEGLVFQYSNNKRNHDAALKDASESYYNVDLLNQTCTCNDFKNHNQQYQLNDVRRLCYHLNQIICNRKLLKRDIDPLRDFVLQNIKGNPLGIYYDKLNCDKPYIIIAYSWTSNIFVATPKTNRDGFHMITWSYDGNSWIGNKGGHIYNQQIKSKLLELFGN